LLPLNTIPASFVPVITELLADQDKLKEMGKAGRERVRKNFRWQHTASRWLSLMNTSDYNKEKELIDQCRR
jgi:spore coat protein SA